MKKLMTIRTKTAVLKERRDGWWIIVKGSFRGIPAKNEFGGRNNETQLSWATAKKYGYPAKLWDKRGYIR